MKRPQLRSRKDEVEKVRKGNTSVSIKREGVETLIEKGSVAELPGKRHPSNLNPMVGMSKGITKNMDNYESLRIDVWYSDSVSNGETTEEALERVESVIDEALENSLAQYLD